jgi:hypothetical protein
MVTDLYPAFNFKGVLYTAGVDPYSPWTSIPASAPDNKGDYYLAGESLAQVPAGVPDLGGHPVNRGEMIVSLGTMWINMPLSSGITQADADTRYAPLKQPIVAHDPAATYDPGDIVEESDAIWIATTTIPAGAFNITQWKSLGFGKDDADADYASKAQAIPAFDVHNTYAVGDIVYNVGKIWVCKTAISTGKNWDVADWTATSGITQTEADGWYASTAAPIATFSSTDTYAVGDLVWYNDELHRCTTAITSPSAFNLGSWQKLTITPTEVAASIASQERFQGIVVDSPSAGEIAYSTIPAPSSSNIGHYYMAGTSETIGAGPLNGTVVSAGDMIYSTGTTWSVVSTGASGTAGLTRAVADTVYADIDNPILAFDATKTYAAGDQVLRNNILYQANVPVPAGAFDATQWTLIADAAFIVAWDASNSYKVGDVVGHGDNIWECIKDSTGDEPVGNHIKAATKSVTLTGVDVQVYPSNHRGVVNVHTPIPTELASVPQKSFAGTGFQMDITVAGHSQADVNGAWTASQFSWQGVFYVAKADANVPTGAPEEACTVTFNFSSNVTTVDENWVEKFTADSADAWVAGYHEQGTVVNHKGSLWIASKFTDQEPGNLTEYEGHFSEKTSGTLRSTSSGLIVECDEPLPSSVKVGANVRFNWAISIARAFGSSYQIDAIDFEDATLTVKDVTGFAPKIATGKTQHGSFQIDYRQEQRAEFSPDWEMIGSQVIEFDVNAPYSVGQRVYDNSRRVREARTPIPGGQGRMHPEQWAYTDLLGRATVYFYDPTSVYSENDIIIHGDQIYRFTGSTTTAALGWKDLLSKGLLTPLTLSAAKVVNAAPTSVKGERVASVGVMWLHDDPANPALHIKTSAGWKQVTLT